MADTNRGLLGERIQWIMTIMNTLHDVFDSLKETHDKIPEQWKQRLPGFLGISLDDERIFHEALSQLSSKEQALISKFLNKKCRDYERNRFINIVAGMEVVPGTPEEREERWNDKSGRKTFNKLKAGKPGIDRRKEFLVSFAKILRDEFKGNLDKAYDFCVAGRIIIPDPIHHKMLRSFSEGIKWFRSVVLVPFGVNSLSDLMKKIRNISEKGINKITREIRKTSLGKPYRGFWSSAFPNKGWAITFGIFAGVTIIMLACGLIFS